jgi:hypothetical protein
VLDSLASHRWSQYEPATTGPLCLPPRETNPEVPPVRNVA